MGKETKFRSIVVVSSLQKIHLITYLTFSSVLTMSSVQDLTRKQETIHVTSSKEFNWPSAR